MSKKNSRSRIGTNRSSDLFDGRAPKEKRAVRNLLQDQNIRRILGGNLKSQWRTYLSAILAMVLVAGMTAATAFIMRDIVDTMTLPEQRHRVYIVAIAVAAIFMIKGVATYLQIIMLSRAGLSIVAEQQGKIYRKLLSQGIAYFHQNESAHLVTRITNGAAAARNITDIVLTSYIRDLLSLVGLLGVMIYQQPFLSIFALMVGPIALLGVRQLLLQGRSIADQELASLSEIIRVMQETSIGVRVIKAFGLENRMTDRMDRAIDSVRARAYSFVRLNALTSPMMDTLSGIAIATIVALSAVEFFGLSDTTPGSLMSFISALLMAYEPAKRLLRTRLQVERNLTAVDRMFDLLDAPDTMVDPPDAQELPPGHGELHFDAVKFSFGRKTVLNGITHTFKPQKTTALVGPSGGGKSTILNLVLRMYDPSSGSITIDGMDLRQAKGASVRSKMAFVSQDTFLFSASVMENLRVGRADAIDEEVVAAARAAHAHEFIMEMPNGYDTQIGENGAFLSGGQKQRIAIARAMLRGAPILLLDEATSALDAHSEGLVRDALDELTKGVTTIVIAHRLSTILTADEICYVEAGEIKEKGTLQELMAMNGRFRRLYDKQYQNVRSF